MFFNCAPLKARPTPNHRRAVVFESGEPNLSLVWAEIKDNHVIIEHQALDECYRGASGDDKPWLDLAVINPVTNGSELFRKIGHGIAMGFPSTTMDPRSEPVDARRRNTGVMDMTPPGHRNLWPGPLVFFCYGYDMRDYVKVDASESENPEAGAEAAMTKLDIWNELDKLRWKQASNALTLPPRDKQLEDNDTTAGKETSMVWRWKVKERGTSMKILDLGHRDLNTIFDYLSCTSLNPIPTQPRGCPVNLQACHVRDPTHPGYSIDGLWTHTNQAAQTFARKLLSAPPGLSSHHPTNPHEPIFTSLTIPEPPPRARPMLGAFAVGLRWLVHYSMDINPPFRSTLPPTTSHHQLTSLLWTLEIGSAETDILQLATPAPTCDSLLVTHARFFPVPHDHVRALWKYLNFTDPRAWARHGPRGFEAYWEVYYRFGMTEGAMSPYEVDGGSWTGDGKVALPSCSAEVGRVWRHMTLEGLGVEEGRREEIGRRRGALLGQVAWCREMGIGFPIGKWRGGM